MNVIIETEWGATRACEHYGDKITSLSMSRYFILTEKKAERGDPVFLHLWDSPDGLGVVEGRVMYRLGIGRKFPSIGIAVAFVGLSNKDREHLKHLIEFYTQPTESFVAAKSLQTSEGLRSRNAFAGV